MTSFQKYALLLIAIWLLIVVVWFRRSTVALIAGMLVVSVYTLIALIRGAVTLESLGLSAPGSWLRAIVFALAGLAVMLAYSPLADKIATRWVARPPSLDAFRMLQQSRTKLVMGIIAAWILGGFLEELIARGLVLQSIERMASPWVIKYAATGIAIIIAAVGAGALHAYQGLRAVIIVTQLSVLFGLLFVLSGYNLWSVVLCHGLYDMIAFIRFAKKTSRYSTISAVS
jgi:membrane protease YdiL (CAAX protease family)